MATFPELLAQLDSVRIGLVGDLIADVYLYTRPARISREAPVPVFTYESEQVIPGGAANTANNFAALGCEVHLVSVVGEDAEGQSVTETLRDRGVHTDGLLTVADRPTVTKTRILAGDRHRTKQQHVRIDRDPVAGSISADLEARVLERLRALDDSVDGWVVSDYGYDIASPAVIAWLRERAGSKPVVVDSRQRMRQFAGVTLMTPNEEEVREATNLLLESDEDVRAAGLALQSELGIDCVLVTRGNLGMMLFERGVEPTAIPIVGTGEVVDVSGAGDTVVTAFTAAWLAGAAPIQAAWMANCAASVVVMKLGAATCDRVELDRVLSGAQVPEAVRGRFEQARENTGGG